MSKTKEGKIKSNAVIVLQFNANIEHPTVIHKGQHYIGTGISAGEVAEEEEEDETPAKKKAAVTEAPVKKKAPVEEEEEDDDDDDEDEAPKKSKKSKRPTEKEMEKMTDDNNAELWEMVDDIKGLRKKILAAEGKNTNKKIRLALLKEWAKIDGAPSDDDDDEEEDEAPKKKVKKAPVDEDEDDDDDEDEAPKKKGSKEAATGSYPKGADKVLRQLDAGDISDPKAIKALVELGADKKAATEFVTEFSEDGSAPVEQYIKKLGKIFTESDEDDEDEEEEAPVKKKSKKVAVDHDELEAGNKVIVKWDDGEEYPGKVASIGKKGIMIDYADGDSDLLDDDMIVYLA
jgi:hypothetical protein